MSDSSIEVRRDGAVATVALNRPRSHNALTPEMITRLPHTLGELGRDEAVRVIVLTGNGRSFCAGADIDFMRQAADHSFEQNVAEGQAIFDLMQAVATCPRTVVGRINGAAIGGGAGLVSCCDIVVAVVDAVFAFSEVRLGILPAVISPFVVPRIGPSAARELFLTGGRFDARWAQRIGLVQHVAADEDALDAMVSERVQQLLQGAPQAQAEAKRLIDNVLARPAAELRSYTSRLIAERRASDEGQEGMSAFLEKRKPWWQME